MIKKIAKIISIYSILLLINSLIGCSKASCGSEDVGFLKVQTFDFEMLPNIEYNTVVYDDTLMSKNQDSISYLNYGIKLNAITEHYYAANKFSFQLFASAYACSPVPPIIEDNIDSITIVSDNSYDYKHVANANLTDLFNITYEYLYGKPNETMPLNEFLATNPKVPNQMVLKLSSAPDVITSSEFTLNIYLKGSTTNKFTYKTPKVKIIK